MNNHQAPQITLQQVNELIAEGSYADAVSLLNEACQAAPRNSKVRYLLGFCLGSLGQWTEAIHVLQQSIDIQPNNAHSHCALGKAQMALKQFRPAAESFEHALKLDSTLTDAHINLAITCFSLQDFSQSRQHYQQALQLDSALSAAYYGLGSIENETGHYEQAIKYLEQALELQPESFAAQRMLGALLHNQAQTEKAVACYEKALQIDPDSVQAAAGLALVHEFRGDTGKAIELIKPLVRRHNCNPVLGIALARLCKHTNQCEEAVDYINRVLESTDPVSTRTRKGLHFAAAGVLDRLQQFDAAFAHYKAGNDTDVQLYDAVGHAQTINNIISTYNPGLYMRLPRSTRHDNRPVFIVGMPRSGTSLTEQILAAHPDVHAAGELDNLGRIVKEMPCKPGGTQEIPGRVAFLGQQDLDNMTGRYLAHLDSLSTGALRITDKMPHNFYYLGIIQLLFPDARIIHCTRNPMDNGLSIYFQDFVTGHDYAGDLFNIGVHYHQYQRLMTHWKQVLTLSLFEVSYEQLVSDQEMVARRMLEFCELEWDANCLQFHEIGRNVHTASYDQVRQPLYNHSVDRWRNYEQYLDELREGLQRGY